MYFGKPKDPIELTGGWPVAAAVSVCVFLTVSSASIRRRSRAARTRHPGQHWPIRSRMGPTVATEGEIAAPERSTLQSRRSSNRSGLACHFACKEQRGEFVQVFAPVDPGVAAFGLAGKPRRNRVSSACPPWRGGLHQEVVLAAAEPDERRPFLRSASSSAALWLSSHCRAGLPHRRGRRRCRRFPELKTPT